MVAADHRVTVVIRTKNRPRLLTRALDDVLGQELTAWRVVLVNDGGDPAPVDAAVDARRKAFGDRIEVIHVDGGTGSMEAAANLGAQADEGEFVIIHDDDDTWAPDFLSAAVARLDAQPEAVAVAALIEIVYEKARGDEMVEIGRKLFAPPAGMLTLFDLMLANRVVPIGLLIRRSAFERIGWFDESLLAVGDWEFNLRLLQLGPVPVMMDRPRAFWHQRPHAQGRESNSIFGGSDQHYHFDRIVRERELRTYLDQHGPGALLFLSKFIEEQVRYYSLQETVRRALHRIRDKFRFPKRR